MKNPVKNSSLIYICYLFVFGCFSAPPSWVDSLPNDKEFFHGVGYAPFSDYDNPKDIARDYAVNEVASQIKVNVTSDLEIVVEDINGNVDNMIKSVMKSRVDLLLPDLEFMDQYNTKTGVYYYVRLHKVKYRQAMERLRQNAISTSLDHIKLADSDFNMNSFSLVQKAWQEIFPFQDEPITVFYENENINLYTLIKRKVSTYNSRLEFKAKLEKDICRTFVDRSNAIEIEVMDNENQKPLSGVPINLKMGDSVYTIYSDMNGIAKQVLSSQIWVSAYSVEFSLDVDKLFQDTTNEYLITLKPTINSITMNVIPAKATIKSDEKNLNEILSDPIIELAIKQYMNNKLEFVSSDPDIEIYINSNTIKKSRRMGNNFPYFSFGNASVVFKDVSTDEQFFNVTISDVKGADFDSQEVAGMRAYDAMAKQLVALIEESLMSN